MEVNTASLPQPNTTSTISNETIYGRLSTYPFDADQEYQVGLAVILGHPQTPASAQELVEKSDLVLPAQCFYFARKFGITQGIDPVAYKLYLETERNTLTATTTSPIPNVSAPVTTAANQPEPPPPYPTSFAEIVELITANKPIPGIQEIPDTVLEPGTSRVDKTPRRHKPWETDDADSATAAKELKMEEIVPAMMQHKHNGEDTDVDVDVGPEDKVDVASRVRETGKGVVKILQPGAIADTGLLAKD